MVRCPLNELPPDLTMMVDEALALIEPPPEDREMNELTRRACGRLNCRPPRPLHRSFRFSRHRQQVGRDHVIDAQLDVVYDRA